jgi:hypothetical protein
MVDNPNMGLQLAKYKFEKLRSKNGTVYNKAAASESKIAFTAVTELGFEKVLLEKNPLMKDGVEIFNGITNIAYKNGIQTGDLQMICYDVIAMNSYRAKHGGKQSPITVQDW